MAAADPPHETAAASSASATGSATATLADEDPPARGDRILAALFWAWAAVLLLATLAQFFGWEGVLDFLDVKRWFSR